jgi:hypothetical protein
MSPRGFFTLSLSTAALLGAMCGGAGIPVVGPSSEQGNPQIVAVVVDDHHRPIASATVFIYKVPVNFDSIDQPSTAALIAVSPTDSEGKCKFEKLVPGVYSIKAIDADSAHSTIKTNIMVSILKPLLPEFSDTLVLTSPGGFHGIVARAVSVGNQQLYSAFIQIKINELDRSTTTGPDGKYSFLNLPSGTYTVYYYTEGFYSTKRGNIIVRPGADTALDSVILKPRVLPPPKGFEAVYDTTAGIIRFNWQKVAFDSLRYYEIDRKCISAPSFDATFRCFDTVWTDTLGSIPQGTVLYYIIRSVGWAFNPSVNAGPIEILVADKK